MLLAGFSTINMLRHRSLTHGGRTEITSHYLCSICCSSLALVRFPATDQIWGPSNAPTSLSGCPSSNRRPYYHQVDAFNNVSIFY
ncbi:hypothetical protein BRADI_5g18202v3 [Brachypodium distachyon]|uniref:Uncharacterized protein n=1 Tax=Brachypodium distachyon TaxID=15368 RepID=A0A2K2CHY5_BRADI|nr:hypothetical protein BRADI_5g18202v3 [Brachypodium distachyon]